jgi:predicted flap endonuclease-1-like 5' DNA nuclease
MENLWVVVTAVVVALLLGGVAGYSLAYFRLRRLEERWRSFVARHKREVDIAQARANDLAHQLEAARAGTDSAQLQAELEQTQRSLADAEAKAALLRPEVDALHHLLTEKEQEVLLLRESLRESKPGTRVAEEAHQVAEPVAHEAGDPTEDVIAEPEPGLSATSTPDDSTVAVSEPEAAVPATSTPDDASIAATEPEPEAAVPATSTPDDTAIAASEPEPALPVTSTLDDAAVAPPTPEPEPAVLAASGPEPAVLPTTGQELPPEFAATPTEPAERVEVAAAGGTETSLNGEDDLTAITGIGPATARRLRGAGVTTFVQLAGLSDEAIDELAPKLKSRAERIKRDGWVEQARKLAADRTD